jgi:hypothetical protein
LNFPDTPRVGHRATGAAALAADGTEHGEQIKDRVCEAETEVLLAHRPPLHAVWPAAGRVPQVRYMPDLFSQTG